MCIRKYKILKKKDEVKMAEEKIEGSKVGMVTHYFPKAKAAVVKFKTGLKTGEKIKIKGFRGEKHEPFEFEQSVESMQREHDKVEKAKSGDELGLAVEKEAKEGDEVYKL